MIPLGRLDLAHGWDRDGLWHFQQRAQLKSQSFFLSIFPLTMFKLCKCRKKKEKKKVLR